MGRLHGGNCCQVCFKRRATSSCVARWGNGWCGVRLCDECAKPAPSGHGRHLCPEHSKPIIKAGGAS
jgi:hypothetical protein